MAWVDMTGPPRDKPDQVVSPRSAGSFNVVCWCQDQGILAQIAQDPRLEYTPEDSTQTIVFNRYSALSPLPSDLRITAVVYLICDPTDLQIVQEVAKNFDQVWNHFVVGPDSLQIPTALAMPLITERDNLMKAIHEAYLDLITVIDGFLVSTKAATVQSISLSVRSAVAELLDIAGGHNSVHSLTGLRQHWRRCRAVLWSHKRLVHSLPTRLFRAVLSHSVCKAPTNGELKLQIGSLETTDIQSKFHLSLSTTSTPYAPGPEFKTCWASLALRPRQGVDPSMISLLVDKAREAIQPRADYYGTKIG